MTWTPSTQQVVKEALMLLLKWVAVARTDEENSHEVNTYLDGMLTEGDRALELIRQEEEK